ncbi:hypothetical protein BC834DRAFT_969961 [Gloeopeniophorella convolvens]|nr:hypothetical protein BC834DRAFT_969961 [Gloeopeniophorella convolvens]
MSHATTKYLEDWVLTREIGVASFTLLVWDHILTVDDEIKYIWQGEKGTAAPYPNEDLIAYSCTIIFDSKIGGAITSSSAWLPLLYDTVFLSLTLIRTVKPVLGRIAGEILAVLLREGLLYYRLELCLTVAMMSRITLHLKRFAAEPSTTSQRLPRQREGHAKIKVFDGSGDIVRFASPGRPEALPEPDGLGCEMALVAHGSVTTSQKEFERVFDISPHSNAVGGGWDKRLLKDDEEIRCASPEDE